MENSVFLLRSPHFLYFCTLELKFVIFLSVFLNILFHDLVLGRACTLHPVLD